MLLVNLWTISRVWLYSLHVTRRFSSLFTSFSLQQCAIFCAVQCIDFITRYSQMIKLSCVLDRLVDRPVSEITRTSVEAQ